MEDDLAPSEVRSSAEQEERKSVDPNATHGAKASVNTESGIGDEPDGSTPEHLFRRLTSPPPPLLRPEGEMYSQVWSAPGHLRTFDTAGTRVAGTPVGRWHLMLRSLGIWNPAAGASYRQEVERAAGYPTTLGDWGRWTGFDVGPPFGRYQRGRYANLETGTTAFQMRGAHIGTMVNTASFHHCDEVDPACTPGGGIQSHYRIELSDARHEIYPWRGARPDSEDGLMLQAYVTNKWIHRSTASPVAELSFHVSLHDTSVTPPRWLSFLVLLYRSDALDLGEAGCSDSVALHDSDADGQAESFYVSSRIASDTCYTTLKYTQRASTFGMDGTWNDAPLMRVHITRGDLLRVIERVNATSPHALSTDLDQYRLTDVDMFQELFPISGEISHGFSHHHLAAYQYVEPKADPSR